MGIHSPCLNCCCGSTGQRRHLSNRINYVQIKALQRQLALLSQRDEYRLTYSLRREQEIHVRNSDACIKWKVPTTQCRAESDMAECLQGLRIALLTADGVGQVELEASGEAVRRAGAQTQLLSLRTGHIEALDKDLGPARRYTAIGRRPKHGRRDEALLLVPAAVKSDRLSSHDLVVSFVHDFITSGKPVGIVCYGAWTLLEAGVARAENLPSSATMRAQRKTGAAVLRGELISPRELSAFYSTIVKEFARLTRQPAPSSAEETEHAWAQVAVLPRRPGYEKYSAAKKVAGSMTLTKAIRGSGFGRHQTRQPAYPQRLRRVHAARHAVGAFAAMPHMWTRRLLRFVTTAARHRPFSCQ